MLRRKNLHLRPSAIKESIDNLPYGILFAKTNGMVILCNRTMYRLSQGLQGSGLQDALAFWQAVEQAGQAAADGAYLLRPGDGKVWLLRRTLSELEGRPIYEFGAQDMTQLYALNCQLREDNRRLAEIAGRLRRYNQNAQELAQARELLERKTRTHDELGRLLTQTQYYLAGGDADGADLWRRWHLNAELMREEIRGPGDHPFLEQLREAARAVGVTLTITGPAPEEGRAGALLLAAGGEALTNLLRHAQGDRLDILVRRGEGMYHIVLQNNGKAPQGAVTEGGGLSALRRKVEEAGGAMEIRSQPVYQLILALPERREGTHAALSDPDRRG